MEQVNSEIVQGSVELKPTETHEKVVLPSEQDINEEKNRNSLIDELNQDHELKDTETVVKDNLPTKEDLEQARAEKQEHLDSIVKAAEEKEKMLNHVEPEEKIVLPDKQEYEQVKQEKENFRNSIESFDKSQLNATETKDATVDNMRAGVMKGATAKLIAQFDKGSLKPTETHVTNKTAVIE